MPEHFSSGVPIEEIRTAPVPIEGVSTSTAGFVGQTERGPATPRMVTSWLAYQRWFGGPVETSMSYLPWAVQGFFDNGGQRAFIARITAAGSQPAGVELGTSDSGQSLRLETIGNGGWGNNVYVRVVLPQHHTRNEPGFRLTLLYYTEEPIPFLDPFDPANLGKPERRDPDDVEEYPNLRLDPLGSGYVLTTSTPPLTWSGPAGRRSTSRPPCPTPSPSPTPASKVARTAPPRPPWPTTRAIPPPASPRWRRWTRLRCCASPTR
jgi:uncharacterized protein